MNHKSWEPLLKKILQENLPVDEARMRKVRMVVRQEYLRHARRPQSSILEFLSTVILAQRRMLFLYLLASLGVFGFTQRIAGSGKWDLYAQLLAVRGMAVLASLSGWIGMDRSRHHRMYEMEAGAALTPGMRMMAILLIPLSGSGLILLASLFGMSSIAREYTLLILELSLLWYGLESMGTLWVTMLIRSHEWKIPTILTWIGLVGLELYGRAWMRAMTLMEWNVFISRSLVVLGGMVLCTLIYLNNSTYMTNYMEDF
ncbi:MAG: hypothetical protein IJ225_01545 [Solobacterium sp.]|nr:hypothetical protein [Solobacterium sp.]